MIILMGLPCWCILDRPYALAVEDPLGDIVPKPLPV